MKKKDQRWKVTWFCLKELERGVNFNEAPVKEAMEIGFDIFKEERIKNKEAEITKRGCFKFKRV